MAALRRTSGVPHRLIGLAFLLPACTEFENAGPFPVARECVTSDHAGETGPWLRDTLHIEARSGKKRIAELIADWTYRRNGPAAEVREWCTEVRSFSESIRMEPLQATARHYVINGRPEAHVRIGFQVLGPRFRRSDGCSAVTGPGASAGAFVSYKIDAAGTHPIPEEDHGFEPSGLPVTFETAEGDVSLKLIRRLDAACPVAAVAPPGTTE